MADGLGLPGLRYLGEQRLALGARRTVEVPSVRSGRFLWCEGGSVLAVGDGVRGRWSCRLAPGELLLLCPAEQAWVTGLSDHAGELRLFHFEAKEEGHGRGMARWIPPVPVRVPGVEPALQALAAAGANGVREGGYGAGSVRDAGTAALVSFFRAQAHLYELMAAYVSGARQRRGQGSLLAYAEQVRRQMAAYCEREYSIEVIARASGESPQRFYEAFRLLTGLTPHKYLLALRLRKALRLLAAGCGSVAEVAHAVGYDDEFYFSRVFKRELGLAPSAFVRQVRACSGVHAPAGDLAIFGLAQANGAGRAAGEGAPGGGGRAHEGDGAAGAGDRAREGAEASQADSWGRRVLRLGQALGLESVAGHWLSLMDRRLCHLKSLVRSRFVCTPFVVVGVDGNGYRVFGSRHPGLGDLLYISAGFTPCTEVRGMQLAHTDSLAGVAGFGCRAALFLVHGPDRPGLAVEWEEAVRRVDARQEDARGSAAEGAGAVRGDPRCLVVGWSGTDDAAAYERLVEDLTLLLLEPALAMGTLG